MFQFALTPGNIRVIRVTMYRILTNSWYSRLYTVQGKK
jgi:hypothetical protein